MSERVSLTDVRVGEEAVEAVGRVLRSGRHVKGPVVEAFETEFARACGTDHAVAVGSGTAAIHLSLQAAGVGAGDEVVLPGHTFFATVSPVLSLGATPVFVDVDETDTMDPDALAAALAEADDPAAVVPVHIYGCVADVERICAIADRHDAAVIADACQAHFARRDGVTAGTAGDAGAFSFYPTKNMTVGGDGGMLVTDDDALARTARRLRNHGRDANGVHRELGLNDRLSEVHAAVGRVQLDRVEAWNEQRRAVAARYDERLDHPAVETPPSPPGVEHAYHLYVIRVPAADRDPLRSHLDAAGIDTGIHYPTPAHRHPAVTDRVAVPSLSRTERLADEIVSLPMHPRLSDRAVDRVCAAVDDYFDREAA